jgi:putative ABC transport system substrate-binding protein
MTFPISRRQFAAALSGAAAWPIVARGQQPSMPVIGFLSGVSQAPYAQLLGRFHEGLKELGYSEGQNVAIEYRWAEGEYDQLPALAADLVHRQVAVIAAVGGNTSPLAAKAATSTIPIVFDVGADPVTLGLVASLNRPGGNATGINFFSTELEPKRLGILRELVPRLNLIAVLLNPGNPSFADQLKDVQAAATTIGQQIRVLNAGSEADIHTAFRTLEQLRASALLVGADAFFSARREQIVTLANHYAVPAIYQQREFAVAGGLISYGTSLPEVYRLVGVYVGRILRGEKASELPVMQSTKFELVINMKTAKAINVAVPPSLLALADEVIE